MSNLRDLRNRITSVKSTRKITSAMKMVAASKLRQAQRRALAAKPYEQVLHDMLERLMEAVAQMTNRPKIPLIDGTNSDRTHLIIIVSGERGLCGGFNSHLVRKVRHHVNRLTVEGKQVHYLFIGRKAYEILRREANKGRIIGHWPLAGAEVALEAALATLGEFDLGHFDRATIFFNAFKNTMSQIPSELTLIPFTPAKKKAAPVPDYDISAGAEAWYGFEPSPIALLGKVVSKSIAATLLRVMLETLAGEQAARMTAMDNATRNAGKMINDLTITYNRKRQAAITREIIEIVSASEAMAA
jgi:F-type H+-transporting ATPase subunit gamma